MRNRFLLSAFAISLLIVSCDSDDGLDQKIEDNMLDKVWVHDLANKELASDLKIVFNLSTTNNLDEVSLLISKETPANPITIDYLSTLSDNNFTKVNLSDGLAYDVTLDLNQIDTDNEALMHDQSYVIYLYSPELGVINKAELPFLFSDNKVYNGYYAGIWTDDLFGTTSVSIILSYSSNDTYEGPTYISSTFLPSFGGDDDGTTIIKVVNNEIVSFKYLQDAPNYKDGCPGIYTGSGSISSSFKISIDFTGDDCDGFHENAQFVLSRVWRK